MANSYDISTVVSRSYISEQLQDQMQKGAENRNAEFIAQFQKESEKKGVAVVKSESSGGASAVKKDDKNKDRRDKKKKKEDPRGGSNGESTIDLKA